MSIVANGRQRNRLIRRSSAWNAWLEGPADFVEGSRHCGRVRDYAVIDYRELSFLEVLATVLATMNEFKAVRELEGEIT